MLSNRKSVSQAVKPSIPCVLMILKRLGIGGFLLGGIHGLAVYKFFVRIQLTYYANLQVLQYSLLSLFANPIQCDQNYKSILQPIKFKSEIDIVTFISKHKDAECIIGHLSQDSLKQLVDALIRSDNSPDGVDKLELNLHALNPSFFDDRDNNPRNNTYKKLRNLYTNCVRNMCLE